MTEQMPDLPERPPLTINVGDQEIKMTYGLEMDIRRMLPDPVTALAMIRDDPFTQDYIFRRVMTPTKRMIIDRNDLVDMDDLDITSDDVEAVLLWATEHALYFFVKRTLGMANLGVRYKQALPMPSTAGSEDSGSTTPSAGPSAA